MSPFLTQRVNKTYMSFNSSVPYYLQRKENKTCLFGLLLYVHGKPLRSCHVKTVSYLITLFLGKMFKCKTPGGSLPALSAHSIVSNGQIALLESAEKGFFFFNERMCRTEGQSRDRCLRSKPDPATAHCFSIRLLLCGILSVNQNSTLVDKFIVLSNILRWYNLFPRFFVQIFASKVLHASADFSQQLGPNKAYSRKHARVRKCDIIK